MTPGQASAQGQALIIEIDGMRRPAAHVFDVPGGVIFVDNGYTTAIGTHPIHLLGGDFTEQQWAKPDMLWAAKTVLGDVFIESSDHETDGTRDQAWQDVTRIFPEYR